MAKGHLWRRRFCLGLISLGANPFFCPMQLRVLTTQDGRRLRLGFRFRCLGNGRWCVVVAILDTANGCEQAALADCECAVCRGLGGWVACSGARSNRFPVSTNYEARRQ